MFHNVFVCVLLYVVTVRGCDLILDNPSNEVTVSKDKMTFKWKVNNVDNTIDILLHSSGLVGGSSASWFAFGLSEAGGMLGADIVSVEFGSSGSVSVVDRYVSWVASPLEQPPRPHPGADTQQDWELVCGESLENSVTAVVRRKLTTPDEEEDRAFVRGSVSVIYAWGDGAFGYHGSNRGSIKVDILSDKLSSVDAFVPPADADGSFVKGFSPGYELLPTKTQYVCQVHDVGTTPLHVISSEQVYSLNEVYGPYVHHVLVHACGNDLDALHALNLYEDGAFPCQSRNMKAHGLTPSGLGPCSSLLYAGASRGHPFVIPDEAGILIGSDLRYIVVEAHLDNPKLDTGVTVTDIARFHTTSTLRPLNAGSMAVGDPAIRLKGIPGGDNHNHFETTCPSGCTETYPIERHLFSSFLHMHQFGRTIWTSLMKYDGDKLLSKNVYDYREFWNFGFQELTKVDVTISPGDQISTHCIYDTTKSGKLRFGADSSDEMCMSFLFYYPYDPNDAYFCGYYSARQSLCGQRGLNVIRGPNPIPDGDLTLPSELFVSYESKDNDGNSRLVSAIDVVVVFAAGLIFLGGVIYCRHSQSSTESGSISNDSIKLDCEETVPLKTFSDDIEMTENETIIYRSNLY